jgi:hypothetical protein
VAQRVSISFKETAVDAINLAGRFRLGRVQRAEVGANLPNTPVKELGSDKLVGRIFDLADVTATVNSMDVGARTSFSLAGVDWASAASGTYIEMSNITYVCLAQPFKSATKTSDDIARTLYVPGAKLERFSFNYSVGGDATEEYSFNATSRRWLKYDVALASGTVSSSGVLSLGSTARVLKNGSYVLNVFASGLGYVPNESILSSTSSSVTLDTSVVTPGTFVVVTYHADLTDQWDYTYEFPHVKPDYTPPPDQPVGVRGWGVEVYLVKSGSANERVYRAQTCTIQGQYPNTKIQELGNEEYVGYMDDIPDVTGTLEIMTFDFRLQELLSGDTTGDNWAPSELGEGDWGLMVKLFRRGASRSADPEKTIFLPALDITQENDQAQVGADQRQTFNFSSRTNQVFVFKGARPTTFWG